MRARLSRWHCAGNRRRRDSAGGHRLFSNRSHVVVSSGAVLSARLLQSPPLLLTPLRLSSPTLCLPCPANPSPRPPLRVAMRLFCGCFRDCAAGQRLSRFLHFRLEKRHRFWCHFSAPEIGQPVCAHGRPLLGGASQAPKSGLALRVGTWTWFGRRKTAQG